VTISVFVSVSQSVYVSVSLSLWFVLHTEACLCGWSGFLAK